MFLLSTYLLAGVVAHSSPSHATEVGRTPSVVKPTESAKPVEKSKQQMAAKSTPVETIVGDYKEIDPSELEKAIKSEKIFLFDANTRKSFKAGHLPGAENMSPDEVRKDKLPKQKDAKLVFYCSSEGGTLSHKAAKQAIELGYHNVWVMSTGLEGWKKSGKPLER